MSNNNLTLLFSPYSLMYAHNTDNGIHKPRNKSFWYSHEISHDINYDNIKQYLKENTKIDLRYITHNEVISNNIDDMNSKYEYKYKNTETIEIPNWILDGIKTFIKNEKDGHNCWSFLSTIMNWNFDQSYISNKLISLDRNKTCIPIVFKTIDGSFSHFGLYIGGYHRIVLSKRGRFLYCDIIMNNLDMESMYYDAINIYEIKI